MNNRNTLMGVCMELPPCTDDDRLLLLKVHAMEQKILELSKDAVLNIPQHQFEQAKGWYEYIGEVAQAIGNGDRLLGCAVVAALSPQISVKENLKLAEQVINGRRAGHYSALIEKAARLIELSEMGQLTEETAKEVLNGLKITAFFENMYRPETSQAVTIDVWMLRFFSPDWKHVTKNRYNSLQNTFAKVANKLGFKPHELQAICWTYIRGELY